MLRKKRFERGNNYRRLLLLIYLTVRTAFTLFLKHSESHSFTLSTYHCLVDLPWEIYSPNTLVSEVFYTYQWVTHNIINLCYFSNITLKIVSVEQIHRWNCLCSQNFFNGHEIQKYTSNLVQTSKLTELTGIMLTGGTTVNANLYPRFCLHSLHHIPPNGPSYAGASSCWLQLRYTGVYVWFSVDGLSLQQ